jgi:anti-sigma factor RsiW
MAEHAFGAERFEAMLNAYGADPRRWPASERAAAEAFAAHDPRAPALLAAAADLDAAIGAASPSPASAALREAIVASARIKAAPRRSLWWAGAGLGAALAGAAAGAVTVGIMAPGMSDDLSIEQVAGASTAFSQVETGAGR